MCIRDVVKTEKEKMTGWKVCLLDEGRLRSPFTGVRVKPGRPNARSSKGPHKYLYHKSGFRYDDDHIGMWSFFGTLSDAKRWIRDGRYWDIYNRSIPVVVVKIRFNGGINVGTQSGIGKRYNAYLAPIISEIDHTSIKVVGNKSEKE